MRVASTQYHTTMNSALQDASYRLEHVMQQMASGLRIQVPSDDPVTSVRIERLKREESALDQYKANIGALRSRLQQNEALLDGSVRDILQARDLMVWAADGGNTSQDVNAMANALMALRDSLYYTANSVDQEGRYVFSGTATATATITLDPLAASGARYTATGNGDAQNVVVGNGVTQAANTTLAEMAPLLNALDLTIDTLHVPGVGVNDPLVRPVVTAALDGLDTALNHINTKIATLGGAQNMLVTLEDNHANVSLSNHQAMVTLGQLDYGAAAVQLNGYTTAVQATQKAYAKVSTLSLFDLI